jgi:hypothetical protein
LPIASKMLALLDGRARMPTPQDRAEFSAIIYTQNFIKNI